MFGQSVHHINADCNTHSSTNTSLKAIETETNFGLNSPVYSAQVKKSKYFSSLNYGFGELIDTPILPTFWRALIDNDNGNYSGYFHGQWKIASLYAACKTSTLTQHENCSEALLEYSLSTTPEANCSLKYTFYANGTIKVHLSYKATEGLPDMPRFGVSFKIPARYEYLSWYGKGYEETYNDRNLGAKLGIYKNRVPDNMARYLVPQECGNKVDVRYFTLTDKNGLGIKISSSTPFEFSALPYDMHQIESAMHPFDLPEYHHTCITIGKQKGVGGDDSWGAPTHSEFLINSNEDHELEFIIESYVDR